MVKYGENLFMRNSNQENCIGWIWLFPNLKHKENTLAFT